MVQKSTPPLHLRRVEDQGPEDLQVGGRRLQREEGPVQAGQPLHRYRPVDPKPPSPRSLSASSCTSTNAAVSTRWITSWAIRSPRSTS